MATQTRCPFLTWENLGPEPDAPDGMASGGWRWKPGFWQGEITACQRKECDRVRCHNYGELFDRPSRLRGPWLD